jgi:hypothetical protein
MKKNAFYSGILASLLILLGVVILMGVHVRHRNANKVTEGRRGTYGRNNDTTLPVQTRRKPKGKGKASKPKNPR